MSRSDTETKSVTAGGGVLFRKRAGDIQVLLIYRRGVWDLPKGKLEEGESVSECARREVSEEVGCPLPEITAEIMTTYHEYEEEGSRIGKTTHWFAMRTDDHVEFTPEAEEDIEELTWCSLDEAKERVGYHNLRKLLEEFENSK